MENNRALIGMHIGSVSNLIDQHQYIEKFDSLQVYLTESMSSLNVIDQKELFKVYALNRSMWCHTPFVSKLMNKGHFNYRKTKDMLIKMALDYGSIGLNGVVTHLSLPYSKNDSLSDSFREDPRMYHESLVSMLREVLPFYERTNTFLCLENTVGNSLGTDKGDLYYLVLLIREVGSSHLRICLDTEHMFARGTVDIKSLEYLKSIRHLIPVVHLNAIPEGVTYGSNKDRHSETPLSECSVFTPEDYKAFIEMMSEKDRVAFIFERSKLSISLKDREFIANL